jgi:CubicO group peptidase (beta-lactamase class C family)
VLNIEQLEQCVADVMQSSRIPGLALAIISDRSIMYAHGFGVTSLEHGAPVTPQTLFRIGSTTKSLTGTAVMRLVEQGQLALDVPIRAYIDWFMLRDPGAADAVTLRMLLSHTAGLPTDWEIYNQHDPAALARHVREDVPRYPLIGAPGAKFEYSNVGTNIAGYLIEVVTGKAFVAAMQDLVFDPLEMQRTTFDPTVAMTYPLAQGHTLAEDGSIGVHHQFVDHTAHYPAGFAISTVHDLANFAIMHLNGGRFRDQQLLTPESVALMHSAHTAFRKPAGEGYGLTFMIEQYKGVRLVGHSGSIPYFHSRFYLVPDADVAVIAVANCMAGFQQVINNVLDQLLDLAPEPS